MANSTAGFGFQNIGVATGVTPSFGTSVYPINYSYATTIGRGCLVDLGTDGYIALSTPTSTAWLGVFSGGYKTDTALSPPHTEFNAYIYSATAVSGSVYGYVNVDPNAVYYGRVSGGPLTFADVGANVTFVAGTVNTTTGRSTDLINATVTTLNTAPFRVVGVNGPIGNDPASSYNIVQVKLNASALANTTGQV